MRGSGIHTRNFIGKKKKTTLEGRGDRTSFQCQSQEKSYSRRGVGEIPVKDWESRLKIDTSSISNKVMPLLEEVDMKVLPIRESRMKKHRGAIMRREGNHGDLTFTSQRDNQKEV